MSSVPHDMNRPKRRSARIDHEIGHRVRHLRKVKGITQSELANALGLSFQQVQKYEKGVSRVSVQLLMMIAEYLEVDIGELIDAPDPQRAGEDPSEAEIRDLVAAFGSLEDRAMRSAILELVKKLAIDSSA